MKTTELYLDRKACSSEVDLDSHAREIMRSFFEDYEIGMCHELLWTMMKSVIISEESTLDTVERMDLVSYYERVHEVLVAGSILYGGDLNPCRA